MNSGCLDRFFSGFLSIGLICFVLFGSASATDGNTKRKPTTSARLGQPFKLRNGQQVTLRGEKLRIRFASVGDDSRCPSDVTCVWAGNAAVNLDVTTNGRSEETLKLNTAGSASLSREAQYQRYKISLVELSPYPRSTGKIAAGDYVVTLLVSKK